MSSDIYPYLVGSYETMTYFLAGELVRERLITHDQYEKVHEYIQQRVKRIKTRAQEVEEEEAKLLAADQ